MRRAARFMIPFLRAAAAAFALAASSAGCGATEEKRTSPGRTLFAQACAGCHTLSGTYSPARQGGDLLGFHLSHQVLLQFAREMPRRRPLTPADLESIVAYVAAAQRR